MGIYGWARTSGGIGVLGNAATGSYAGYFSGKVYSSCSTADGDCLYVRNTASGDDADAITGFSLASKGVQGMTSTGVGVMGRSDAAAGTGVFGSNVWGGYAGYFDGKLAVNGAAYKPGGGSWSVLSDARAKRAVTGYQAGLAALSRVRPVWYQHNGHGGTRDDGTRYVGVVAQELEANLPYMVGEGAGAGARPRGGEGR